MNRYIEQYNNYRLPHPFRAGAERLAMQFDTDTYKDENGVLRWLSNNSVPPQEVLDFWRFMGKRFNMNKSMAARKRETKAVIEKYKQQNRGLNDGERYEAQSVFGKNTIIRDAITGRETRL